MIRLIEPSRTRPYVGTWRTVFCDMAIGALVTAAIVCAPWLGAVVAHYSVTH